MGRLYNERYVMIWNRYTDDEKYVKSSLPSTIWHFLSPSVRVFLTGCLVVIMIIMCISRRGIYQELWYLLLLFCSMYNGEILKGSILRRIGKVFFRGGRTEGDSEKKDIWQQQLQRFVCR